MQTPHEGAGPAPQDALLEVDAHVSRDAYLLEVAGELDRSTAGLLESHLWDADLSGRSRIVVDLGALAFMDSAGLRVLLRAAGAAGTRDRIHVVSPSRAVRRVIELTGTGTYLPVVE